MTLVHPSFQWMNSKLMDRQMDMEKCGVVNGQTDKEIEKWMIDEYMNEWMDGYTEEWTDRDITIFIPFYL